MIRGDYRGSTVDLLFITRHLGFHHSFWAKSIRNADGQSFFISFFSGTVTAKRRKTKFNSELAYD